jgi:hypothetical protein
LRKEKNKVAGVFPLPPYFYEISEKAKKSLITRITNTLKNEEKSGESFFEICVIRERKVFFQSSPYRGRR